MTLKNIFLGFLIGVLLLVGYAIHAGIALVSVRSPEARLWIPVPIALGHLVGKFIDLPLPKEQQIEELMGYRTALAAIVRELHDLPDCTLVEVDKQNEKVRISKLGNSLLVSVDDQEDHVRLRIPLQTVDHLMEAIDKPHPTVGDIVACLEWQPSGDLVYVKSKEDEVRISIW
jgi:hypothetical protein